ncbi:MAG TPA: MMPL family transporter [Mycobacteriales bacterium]|nr:MMPL family transporter [Mycobacteriales bacterium]
MAGPSNPGSWNPKPGVIDSTPVSAQRSRRGSPTVRLARWSARHPWRAVLGWVAFVAVCVAAGQLAGTRSATSLEQGTGESGRAAQILHDAGMESAATEQVLINARTGRLDLGGARAVAAEVGTRMRVLPDVASVEPTVTAADGSALLVPVIMRGSPDDADTKVGALLRVTAGVASAHPELRVQEVGDASIDKGVNDLVSRDFGKAEGLSLPITLVILLVAFGALVAAGVPVLLGISAVGGAIGLSALVSHLVPATDTLNNVILLLGMAVGVDYSLFYLKREREERAAGRSRQQAIEVAAATSGHSVVVSAIAVMVSMAGLYLAQDVTFSSLATGSLIVVAVAVVGSVTVLPALLMKLGGALERPRIPLLWRWTNNPDRRPRFWPALLRPALARPGRTLAVAVVAMLALAAPALGMTLRSTTADDLPRSIPAMHVYDRMNAAFPTRTSAHQVVVQAPTAAAGAVSAALEELQHQAAQTPLLSKEQNEPIRSSADGGVHVVDIDTPFTADSARGTDSLQLLREQLLPDVLASVAAHGPVRAEVGGDIAETVDYSHHNAEKLPWVIGFVLLLTLAVMLATFRSPVIALMSIAVNLLSAAASFGFLTLVFQHRFAEGLLRFHSTGAVVSWVPLFLFVVLFGLSMDYHVFVLTRIREGVARGLNTRAAVEYGLTRTAGVVTSAAVVMVSIFAVFATLQLNDMKQVGLGLAVAVLLDALVVRIVILPAAMVLLGRWSWRPNSLVRQPEPVPDGELLQA